MINSKKLLALMPKIDTPRPEHAWMKATTPAVSQDKLVLKIFSFSFHRSTLPKDESGHGGGFVFDARGLPNPGREERFKNLTGKDAPVIEFLEEKASVHEFLADAIRMVEGSVKNYLQRGFKSLTVSSGCTGGQHRSVYLAEAMAKHFQSWAGVEIRLQHLELEKLAQ